MMPMMAMATRMNWIIRHGPVHISRQPLIGLEYRIRGAAPISCVPRTSVLPWQFVTSVVIEEVRTMATHSKTRRAVKRLRRLARRLRDSRAQEGPAQRGGQAQLARSARCRSDPSTLIRRGPLVATTGAWVLLAVSASACSRGIASGIARGACSKIACGVPSATPDLGSSSFSDLVVISDGVARALPVDGINSLSPNQGRSAGTQAGRCTLWSTGHVGRRWGSSRDPENGLRAGSPLRPRGGGGGGGGGGGA